MTAQDILSRLQGVRGGRGQWAARCPAHDDRQNSLSVSEGNDGRVLLHCHAGCDVDKITAALGVSPADLFPDKPRSHDYGTVEREHIYPGGQLKKVMYRKADGSKYGCWFHKSGNAWVKGRGGAPPTLYIAGELSGGVFVCEGEKDVDTIRRLGYNAASGADGAGPGKWKKEYTEQLRGCTVCVFTDNDDVGRAYAAETCNALHGVASSVQLLDVATVWPDIPTHGDVSDMVAALGEDRARGLIRELVTGTPEWVPNSFVGFVDGGNRENDFCEFCYFCEPDMTKNPIFPNNEFSRELRNFSACTCASLQVPLDMPSVSTLAMTSLCAQRKFKVHPRARHYEPVNLYAVIVARPSERKSPTVAITAHPIYQYQHDENDRRRAAVEEYRTKKDLIQRRIESIKKATTSGRKAKSESFNAEDDIRLLQQELIDLEKDPINFISLTADDITMEALTSKMAANGEKMALISSEGGLFNVLSGLYTGGISNIDVILKAWSGDHVEVDRKNRGSEVLMNPALTILLMVQPRVLEAVMNNAEFAGRGLNARFLYSIPVSTVGTRVFDAPDIPQEVIDDYNNLLLRILAIPDTGEPRIIECTDEARDELRKIHDEIEPRLITDLEPMGDWVGKYEGTVIRIAGILHICDHVERAAEVPIPGETIRRASRIGEYFLAHARIAYQLAGQMDDQPTKDAKYILKRLDSTGRTEISKRDLYDLCKGRVGFETVDKMEPGLDVLVKRGYIKIERAPKSQNSQNSQNRGRPSYMICVNPIYTAIKEEGKL